MFAICLSEFEKEDGKAIFTAECSHSFHFDCISSNVEHGHWICPLCRIPWKQIPSKNFTHVRLFEIVKMTKKVIEDKYREMHDKFDAMDTRLKSMEQKKSDHEVEAGEETLSGNEEDMRQKSMCAICLYEIKKKDGKAIFTAECSHSFHFDCITSHVEHGNRICPSCKIQWKQVPSTYLTDVRLFEIVKGVKKVIDDGFKKILEKFDAVNTRLDKIREKMDAMETRKKEIYKKFIQSMEQKKSNREDKADEEASSGNEEHMKQKESNQGVEAVNEIEGVGEDNRIRERNAKEQGEREGENKKMKKMRLEALF